MNTVRRFFPDARLAVLFALFFVANLAYLHRVPGFLGDEASEGENAYQILTEQKIPVLGERSYIGVLTDYARMPFIAVLGYSSLAVRLPVFFANLAFFIVSAALLKKYAEKEQAYLALVFLCFSPIFITYQRLGWAITLLPLFAVLLIYTLQSKWKYHWLLAGGAAGVGLQTHLLFLPTLIALFLVLFIAYRPNILRAWPALVGFWAGFGMQAAILSLMTEDQGDTSETTLLFGERISDLWHALPLYVSGSSFIAQYTGMEFSQGAILGIFLALSVGVLLAFVLVRTRIPWIIASITALHTVGILYMIDRYSLRYFVITALGVWLLAGLGFGAVMEKLVKKLPVFSFAPIAVAVFLLAWSAFSTLIPFLKTGGSVAQFDLGNRTTSASSFVDDRPLIACLRGKGTVFSEVEPIQNILLYRSHQYDDLIVADEDSKKMTQYIVAYASEQEASKSNADLVCPKTSLFRVIKK